MDYEPIAVDPAISRCVHAKRDRIQTQFGRARYIPFGGTLCAVPPTTDAGGDATGIALNAPMCISPSSTGRAGRWPCCWRFSLLFPKACSFGPAP